MNFKDQPTLDLFRTGNTDGVPYFSDSNTKILLKSAKPTSIDDLITIYSLDRPSMPKETVVQYLGNRNDRNSIQYIHPLLVGHLLNTHGILLYQEQLMDIVQHLTGCDVEKANEIRINHGKKHSENLKELYSFFKQRSLENPMFVTGCRVTGDEPEKVLDAIWKWFYANASDLISRHTSANATYCAYQAAYNLTHD